MLLNRDFLSRTNDLKSFISILLNIKKGKIRSRLNDIFVVSISFLFFLI